MAYSQVEQFIAIFCLQAYMANPGVIYSRWQSIDVGWPVKLQ